MKAVLGTINPADIATNRLSIGRLESLMFLCGVWCGSSSQLVGTADPGRIFRHIPQQHQHSGRSVQLLVSALSLLAIQQLQGCSSSLGAMPEQFFDVPTLVTAVWIGTLGAYVLWLSQKRTLESTMDYEPMSTVLNESQPEEHSGDETCSSGSTDSFPAFSPEGLISWMFERCNRRFEEAMMCGDAQKADRYNQRRALLVDFLNYVGSADEDERQRATDTLSTMDDLSSHEGSPTKDPNEPHDTKSWRNQEARAAMLSLQAVLATQLQGCSSDGGPTSESWFSFGVLVLWTMLLAMYTWYMLRNFKFNYVPPPPTPTTLGVSHEPQVTEEPTSLEGTVTWTLNRVLRRLERSHRRGNQGHIMKYNQMRIWLQNCISHLHEATAEDRSKMWNALTGDSELSESDGSPSFELGRDERALLVQSHGEIYRCLVKLLELEKIETNMNLLNVFADAFKTPDPPPQESEDESMAQETQSERLRRYQNSEQCEVSDPDEWAVIHYGRNDEDETGEQEF